MKITKAQLRKMIKEEQKRLSEIEPDTIDMNSPNWGPNDMEQYEREGQADQDRIEAETDMATEADDELRVLRADLGSLVQAVQSLSEPVQRMSGRYGEMAQVKSYLGMATNSVEKLVQQFERGLSALASRNK